MSEIISEFFTTIMNYNQIGILILQGFLVAFVILLLFRLRKKLGIGVLFACLGLFQFVQVFLSSTIYVEITKDILVSPGSSVLFPATLFAFLIIYIKEDANETIKIIYALFIVNIVLSILLNTFSWHLNEESTHNLLKISSNLFDVSSWVLLVGTILLVLDSLLIIFIFEFISKKVSVLFLKICLTMLIVMSFDTLFFSIIVFWNSDNFNNIIISNLISKGVFTIFYSAIFYLYLRYFDFKDFDLVHIKINDVFKPLSYKQKFETALIEIKKEKENREIVLITSNKEKENRLKELELSKVKLKKTFEQVRENEYSLKEAGRMAKIGYWRFDNVTENLFWSEALYEMYGYDQKLGVPSIEAILSLYTKESKKILLDSLEKLINKGIPYDIELEFINFKNEKRWIRNIGEPVYNDNNENTGRRGISQDITQTKQNKKNLDKQNKKLNELYNTLNQAQKLSHVGSWQWNMKNDTAEWSDEMYNIYGVSKDSFYPSNENVSKMMLPEDLYKKQQGIKSLMIDKMFVPFEFRIKRPSGEIRHLYIIALEKNSDNSIFGVTKDITERKRIEQENLRIHDNYIRLFDNASVSIWNEDFSLVFEKIDELKKLEISNIEEYLKEYPEVLFSLLENLKVNNVNKATLKLFKAKSKEEFLHNITDTFAEGADKVFLNLIDAIWNNKKTFTSEVNYKTLEGDEFTAIISIPIPQTKIEQKTVPVNIQSIQNLKEAELDKRETLKSLKESQEMAKLGSWFFNINSLETKWSDETYRIWGFNKEKPAPNYNAILRRIHVEDKKLFEKAATLANDKGIPYDIELRIYFPGINYKTIRCICKPIIDENGEVVSLKGTNQDITEQKLIREKIEKTEDMYRLLSDNTNDLICLQEPDSSFKYISPSIKNLLGYKQSDFLGKKVFSIVHKDDVERLKDAMKKKFFKSINSKPFTFRILHKEGHFVWFEFLTSPVYKNNEINYFVTTARDISQSMLAKHEIQEYQKALQKMTTKMTLIEENHKKEIASNIHDHLSQSLVISKMKINELKKNPKLNIINEDLIFIEKHISEVLSNSRKITYELSPPVLYQLGIVDALNWLLEDVEATHKIKCQVISNVSYLKLSDVISILLYRSIQELIKNVLKYANASLIILEIYKNNSGINILLKDNGVGFNTSTLSSFKSQSGSGFGLFAVQERINNIQGDFTIISKINQGTSVNINIPIS